MKIAITTLGCKANQYDSFAIGDVLKAHHFNVVPFSESADAYIINTCTVTNIADFKSRYLIRKAKKTNPDAIVIVTGCYAQVSPDDIKEIDGIDYVLGNAEKDSILNLLNQGKQDVPKVIVSSDSKPLNLFAKDSSERTRAFLKVQDGCNRYCSYCIIPYARGASRSLSRDAVIREVEILIENGYKEIVLTGIHLGDYGSPETNLTELVTEIDRKNYPCRFRISSLDPDEADDELIEMASSSKTICNHFHLAVQSCDDGVLKNMNRHHYSQKLFIEKVEKIYNSVKSVSIGIDIIAGFPGETDEQFMNTYKTLQSLPLAYFHVFPFSKRKGTAAYSFKNHVSDDVIKKRCAELKQLAEEKRKTFYETQIGKYTDVLVETEMPVPEGFYQGDAETAKGKSRNYIPVIVRGKNIARNTEVKTILKQTKGKEVIGIYEG